MVDDFDGWRQFDKQRKDWMNDKQLPGFSAYVRMYPPRLPRSIRVFDIRKERRIIATTDGEILTHPKIMALRPFLKRVQTSRPPLHVIADELQRVWGLSVGQMRGYLMPWIVPVKPSIRDRQWRNPTAEDVARIPVGPKGKTCLPRSITSMRSHWSRVTDEKFKQFLEGKISWAEIQVAARKHGREFGKVNRMTPILFPSHDNQRLANGDFKDTIGAMFVAPCAECGRKPRRYHNKLKDEYKMFCVKTEYVARKGTAYEERVKCSQSLRPHVFFKTHAEAIKNWNETQKELRG